MKGNIETELQSSLKTMQILGCSILEKQEFTLPYNGGVRTLLSIKKEKATDLKYPRTYDKIKKKALR